MEKFLEKTINDSRKYTKKGKVASYIPMLSHVNPNNLGVGVYTLENEFYGAGETDVAFSIQSVGKVFALICALRDSGLKKFLTKVDVEPSGDKYNSLVKLETMDLHRPFNPFINAGAIATIDLIKGDSIHEKFDKVMDLMRTMTDNQELNYNEEVFDSEMHSGDTNKAIAYYLKGAGIIEGNVDEILETYIKVCSIEATVRDMAKAAAVLANNGVTPWNKEVIIEPKYIKIVRALMTTSGLYDGSGAFSVNVGIPAKSGVGGCIFGAVPKRLGIVTYGPSLNDKGNSVAGLKVMKTVAREYDLSIF